MDCFGHLSDRWRAVLTGWNNSELRTDSRRSAAVCAFLPPRRHLTAVTVVLVVPLWGVLRLTSDLFYLEPFGWIVGRLAAEGSATLLLVFRRVVMIKLLMCCYALQ